MGQHEIVETEHATVPGVVNPKTGGPVRVPTAFEVRPASDAHTGGKYVREITSRTAPHCRMRVDVYCVLAAFEVTSQPIGHAVKKLLCPGNRGKGSYRQDLVEARDAITRAIEMEDAETNRLNAAGVYTGTEFVPAQVPTKPLEP